MAAFALADALGVSKVALAHWFSPIEAAMVRGMNERLEGEYQAQIEGKRRG